MRCEQFDELDPGDATLEIPWADPAHPERKFVDLKKFPAAIDRLEECRRRPMLATLLRSINLRASPFRTAKCGVWSTKRLSEDEQVDFRLRFKMGAYVDVLIDRAGLSLRQESHRRLGLALERAVRQCRIQAQMEIALRRCLFHPRERWGYYLTLFVHAYGDSRSEAKREWDRAMGELCRAFSLASVRRSISGRVS